MQSEGNQALFYGTTTVPEGLRSSIAGVVLAVPVQSLSAPTSLLGAVEL